MNVAFEDPFIVIGSNSIIKISDNVKYIEFACLASLDEIIRNRSLSKSQFFKEEYEIDVAYIKNKKGRVIHKGKIIKVKSCQNIKPLQLRLYCELDWGG